MGELVPKGFCSYSPLFFLSTASFYYKSPPRALFVAQPATALPDCALAFQKNEFCFRALHPPSMGPKPKSPLGWGKGWGMGGLCSRAWICDPVPRTIPKRRTKSTRHSTICGFRSYAAQNEHQPKFTGWLLQEVHKGTRWPQQKDRWQGDLSPQRGRQFNRHLC